MRLGIIAAIGAFAPVLFASDVSYGQALSLSGVNAVEFSAKPARGRSPLFLKAQILLDRAGFSPGAIDASAGENFAKALAAYQRQNELGASGKLDAESWSKLSAISADPVLVEYEIKPQDIKGPFDKSVPTGFEKMAKLKHLSYTGPRELLAEKFHMSEDLLKALNPKTSFERAGTRIIVANVERPPPAAKAKRVEVNKSERAVRAFDQDGKLLAFYPATVGSKEKPAPTGNFAVRAVAENPTYRYNPEFAFKEVKVQRKFTIAPGPNSPVGVVWIDLTAKSYGIHGTPQPEQISKTSSHGCVRLTNWDAKALAKLVSKGTPVAFVD